MDLSKLSLFGVVKKRMDWLTQRQEVLSQNIANADTPGYKARDLKKLDFKNLVGRQRRNLNMATTQPGHISGRQKRETEFNNEKSRTPYETAPNGNSVVLEEQMAKLNETGIAHRLATQLYKKNLSMFFIAIGKR